MTRPSSPLARALLLPMVCAAGMLLPSPGAVTPATYEHGEVADAGTEASAVGVGKSYIVTGKAGGGYVEVFEGSLAGSLAIVRPPATEPQPAAATLFGQACDWSGETLLVGAPSFQGAGDAGGKVYCFQGSGETWTLSGEIENPDPACKGFGRRFLTHGDRVFVVAPHNGLDGKIHEYLREAGGTWSLQGSFAFPAAVNAATSAEDPAALACLAFDGTTLVVGIPRGEADRGLAVGFRKTAGIWSEHFRLSGAAGTTGRLGFSLCFAGSELLLGAPKDGKGRVARYLVPPVGLPSGLADLDLPAWVDDAGAGIAHHDGRIMVGAPATTFSASNLNQGAILIADRNPGNGNWEWTGAFADAEWSPGTFFGAEIYANSSRFFAHYMGWGRDLNALEPGPRLQYMFAEPDLRTDEDAGIARVAVYFDRPVNATQMISFGSLAGSASAGSDYVPLNGPEFIRGGEVFHEIPVLITKDHLAEATEDIRFDNLQIFGGDRLGDPQVVSIEDRAPRNGQLPPQIVAHLIPQLHELRANDFWIAPERMSLSDDELLMVHTRDFSSNSPRLLRYVRSGDNIWSPAPELPVPAPSVPGDRHTDIGTLVHDDQLVLLGEAGDHYARGHIRSLVRDGGGAWVPGPSYWPSGTPDGSFGAEIILTDDWVFANQGVYQQSHSGAVHAFRRTGGSLAIHSILEPSDAGLSGGSWGGGQSSLGGQVAWSAPYLAASFTTPGANAQNNQGVAIFKWNEAANRFDYLQKFTFENVSMRMELLEFANGMLIAGKDGEVLRRFVVRNSGLFEELEPEGPPGNWGRFANFSTPTADGFLIGMWDTNAGMTGTALPQLVGFDRAGDDLKPSFGYLSIHPWFSGIESISNVSPAGRVAILHAYEDRNNQREIFVVQLGKDLPNITLTPEVNQVGSDRTDLVVTATLDKPTTMAVPLVAHMEGLAGASGNRDFVPMEQTRYFEAGDTSKEFKFRLIDNPEAVPGAALMAGMSSGYGLENSGATSVAVPYHKVESDLPTVTQRLVPTAGTSFFRHAFDGDDFLFQRIGSGFSGHATRTRTGRVFAVEDGPTFEEPDLFPRTDMDSMDIATHGDLAVLGRPGSPGWDRPHGIRLAWKTGPGAWQMDESFLTPDPFFASHLGSQTASNGRFLAVVQVRDSYLEPVDHHIRVLVYDITSRPARYVGSVTSRPALLGTSLVAIDHKDRLIYRDFRDGACLAVDQLTPSAIVPAGAIYPSPHPRLEQINTFGTTVRAVGNFIIAGDSTGVVDGTSTGVVHVFEHTESGWVTRQVIFPPDPVTLGSFGYNFIAERDWLVIGEPFSREWGSVHFYRTAAAGYELVRSHHALTPPTELNRDVAFGGKLWMEKGCVLVPALERQPGGNGQAVYVFDLTRDHDFATWKARHGMGSSGQDSDADGDGLDLWMEWATGRNPLSRDPWWGTADGKIWFDVGASYNAAARVTIEFSEDLSPGSWRPVAVRDGLADWQGEMAREISPGDGDFERVTLDHPGTRGFYRLRGEER